MYANDFVSGGSVIVAISGGDLGFHTDDDCGMWTRISSVSPIPSQQTGTDIDANLARRRQRYGLR
jgi:hypothetical protein